MVTAAKSLAMNSSVDVIYFLIEDPVFPEPLPESVKCIDVSDQKFFMPGNPNIYKLWTWMVLMRAVLTKYLPEIDRVLSLDNDTIVDQNIDELWDLNLNGFYLAGVQEPLKSRLNEPYVNMGAVMFHLDAIRANKMDDKFVRVLNNTRFRFAEQDCINTLCKHWIKVIPSIYNANDWTEPCENPKIWHFANSREGFRNEPLVKKYRALSWDDIPRPKYSGRTRYMIHSAPARQWYVDEFLIPSMIEQGIAEEDIIVRCDRARRGNLFACMDGFQYCGEHPVADGTWHLQDDAIISRDFAQKTKFYNDGVVCGFVQKEWGPDPNKVGVQPVKELWYSFLCIRIPDELAGECAKWFFEDASKREEGKYRNRVLRNKHDDDFFQFFLFEKHPNMKIRNLSPNIVDHIDFMLGGSLINAERNKPINRAAYWRDEDLITQLEEKLRKRGHEK